LISYEKTNLTTAFIKLLRTYKFKNKITNIMQKKKHKKRRRKKSYLNLIVSEVEKRKGKTNS
jgi:predicted ABC-type exoprotein transport system permease subunit